MVLASLTMGLLLARDRRQYSETVVKGTSQPIVMIMVLGWLLAGVLGTLMSETGLVEALIWLSYQAGVTGGGYVAAAFLICCAVSTSTGTSIGTLLICGPLLYPPGGSLDASPAILMGAILGGATFGDNISPISDTTIASALTQGADIGGVVRSRLKYAIPADAAALVLYVGFGNATHSLSSVPSLMVESSPRGLPMLVAPLLVKFQLSGYRRANLLDATVCTFPFVLPYFITVMGPHPYQPLAKSTVLLRAYPYSHRGKARSMSLNAIQSLKTTFSTRNISVSTGRRKELR